MQPLISGFGQVISVSLLQWVVGGNHRHGPADSGRHIIKLVKGSLCLLYQQTVSRIFAVLQGFQFFHSIHNFVHFVFQAGCRAGIAA